MEIQESNPPNVTPENAGRAAGVIWALNLDAPPHVVSPLLAARFRRAGPESIGALAMAGGKSDSIEIEQRFKSGRRCYAAWVRGLLATYGWVSVGQEYVGELGLRLNLLPGEAYIWDCFTVPAFRRNHLYSALLVYILSELRAGPLCRTWIGADFDNLASQRGIARAGFRPVADLMVAGVGAGRLAWLRGLPGAPESLLAEARRTFLNNQQQVRLAAAGAPGEPASASPA